MISRQSLFRILQVSDQADEHQILYQVADSACPSCVDEFCERPLVKVHMLYAKERLEGPLRGFRGEEAATEAQSEDVACIELLHDPLEELIGDVVKYRCHRGRHGIWSDGKSVA